MDFTTEECELFLAGQAELIFSGWDEYHPNLAHLSETQKKALASKLAKRDWASMHYARDHAFLKDLWDVLSFGRKAQTAAFSQLGSYDDEAVHTVNYVGQVAAKKFFQLSGYTDENDEPGDTLPIEAPRVPLVYFFGEAYPSLGQIEKVEELLTLQMILGKMVENYYDKLVQSGDPEAVPNDEEKEVTYLGAMDLLIEHPENEPETAQHLKNNIFGELNLSEQEKYLFLADELSEKIGVPWAHRRFLRDIVAFYRVNELAPTNGFRFYVYQLQEYLRTSHGIEVD